MAENKTQANDGSVEGFIDGIADPRKREDAQALTTLMARVTGEPAVMWGPAIIGFGSHRYRYDSGREGDICRIGFSPRARALVLYGMDIDGNGEILARLGKHDTSKACLSIKRLDDVDLAALEALIIAAWSSRAAGA